jgi:polyisoprenoid-binding protein YceI
MKTIILSILLLGLINTNPEYYSDNSNDTIVSFKIKNMGFYVEGVFTDVLFNSNFNKSELNNSFINATIQVKSLDTGNKKRDKDLMKAKYFDVDKFPEMNFTSTKIIKFQENNYKVTGNLTIKNSTKLITIPIQIDEDNKELLTKSDFELNRRDYKVGGNSWVMSDEVLITVLFAIPFE